MVLLLLLLLILLLGLDRYRYAASADTGQYWSVLVSANTYLSIDANISSPVVRLPVSTVNTVATHAYSFKPIPYFHASTLHTYLTCTHLCPAQNLIFSAKICTAIEMGRMSDYDIRPKPKVWAGSPNECRTFGRTSAECCVLG